MEESAQIDKINPHHHKIAIVLLVMIALLATAALYKLWQVGFFNTHFF